MNKMQLKRIVLLANPMFGWGVHMELFESIIHATKFRRAINRNLDRRAQVLENHRLQRDIDDGLVGCVFDGAVFAIYILL
jgi:hypothetical protein